MKILICGFCGKMGQMLFNASKSFFDIEVVEGLDKKEVLHSYPCEHPGLKLISNINKATICDVVVDFSHASLTKTILNYCVKNKKPLVLATTGISTVDEEKILQGSKVIPIFKSSNMSEGVYVLLNLIKKASKMLEGWDIEIIEKHHSQKVDAPSGTALMMLNEVKKQRKSAKPVYGRSPAASKRAPEEVGIHSIRGGGAVGEHEINFFNEYETIKITHEALSKAIFAEGALKAAKLIYDKPPGLYSMKNLFD